MKKTLYILALALLSCTSCSTHAKYVAPPKPDVGRDTTLFIYPAKSVYDFIEKLRVTDPAGYGLILVQAEWLPRHVVTYARRAHLIAPNESLDSVVYYFGSANAQVADTSGNIWNGRITDELVAFFYPAGSKTPTGDIVYGTIRAFAPLRDSLHRIGSFSSEFTIEKKRGINYYVDYRTSIALAKYFGLPIYRDKIEDSAHKISADSAVDLDIRKVPVTVKVFPGDRFDLDRMVYTRAK